MNLLRLHETAIQHTRCLTISFHHENAATHIVISIGGNDLLSEINFLNPTAIVNQMGNLKFLKKIYSPDSPEYFEEKYEIWD